MKTSPFFIACAAAVLFICTACEKVFFEPQPADDPEAVFEYLWQDFNDHYGPMEDRSVDWNSLYHRFGPRVQAGMSEDSLYAVLTGMLAVLDDGHVNLSAPHRPVFRSNRYFRELTGDSMFNIELVKQHYLRPGFQTGDEESYVHGLIRDDIAYVWFDYVGANWYIMDDLLERYKDVKGLIVDLRHNQGGDFTYAFANMGRFTRQQRLVFRSQTKNGPGPDDFTPWYEWRLEPKGVFWDKKIAVLIDRFTISAGERAAMAFRALPQVIMVGDTTNGATSTMVGRELANGWHYSIPTQRVRMFDGRNYEGIGLAPDVRVLNTPGEMRTGKDAVLERAKVLVE